MVGFYPVPAAGAASLTLQFRPGLGLDVRTFAHVEQLLH